MRAVLTKRLTCAASSSGTSPTQDATSGATSRLAADGRVRYREDVVDGLENAPAAFIGLLKGRNFGKLLVRVAAPARG